MIGPVTKLVEVLVCSHPRANFTCDALIWKGLEATKLYPRARRVCFCKHPDLDTQVAFIKDFPRTPKWCPAKKNEKKST